MSILVERTTIDIYPNLGEFNVDDDPSNPGVCGG